MTCPRCIEVPTLQSVYDSETRDYDEDSDTPESPRDLVYEAMNLTGGVYGAYEDAVAARIWNDYRYRMLGTCDTDMFVQILADRLTAEAYTAVAQIKAVTDASDTIGDTDHVVTSGEHTDTLGHTREDMPDNFNANFTYPSDKSEDSNVYGEHVVTEYGAGRTKAEAVRAAMQAFKDPLDDLMRAISVCWLNRW
jgi:hypothetical protein